MDKDFYRVLERFIKLFAAWGGEVTKDALLIFYDLLDSLDTKNGKVQTPVSKFIQLANTLIKELNKAKDKSFDITEASDLLKEAHKENLGIVNFYNDNIIKSEPKDNIIKSNIDNTLFTTKSTLFDNFVKNIMIGALYASLSQKQSIMITKKAIKQRLYDKNGNSNFQRNIETAANDSLFQYIGGVNSEIALEYDLPDLRYIGGLVSESRPFCIFCIKEKKRVILGSELEALLLKALSDPTLKKGLYPYTNVDNFKFLRGGHNCKHYAIPIKIN